MTRPAAGLTQNDPRAAEFRADGVAEAAKLLSGFAPGCRVIGLTMGQFSLLDLIKATLNKTGPAHVALSTWTMGIRDAENANFLVDRGLLLSLTLLVDRSFPTRQPEYCARIVEMFGADSIRMTQTHAKFALIENDEYGVAIRSSMNLNRNPRFEQFDLDDDRSIVAFFRSHMVDIFERVAPGMAISEHDSHLGFTQCPLGAGGQLDGSTPKWAPRSKRRTKKRKWS
jgi:hypothetical protein